MDRILRSGLWAIALLAFLATAGPAGAASIAYSDCNGGGSVMYIDISESGNQAPLYGAPTCTGNQIDFDPTNFQLGAGNPDPSGAGSLDGQLNFTIMSTPGQVVDTLSISESGDRQVIGGVPTTFASVSLIVRLEIIVPGPLGTEFTVEFEDQQSDTWSIPADFSFTPETWDLAADFIIADVLDAACNGTGQYTVAIPEACDATSSKVKVVMDNTLSVFASSGERAFVNKKDVDGVTVTANEPDPVPEPGTAALLALGLLGLAVRARPR